MSEREYEAIWNKIKKTSKCVIEVPALYASRVKKAVIKEKDIDRIFKQANKDDPCKLNVVIKASNKPALVTIEFTLHQTYGITDIKRTP